MDVKEKFKEIIRDKRALIETFFVVENKQRQLVPFKYNKIQDAMDRESTGFDITVKPSQVGFSTERIANRLADTLTVPGTNTVLVAYEDFITQRLLAKVSFFYNHLSNMNIPGFPVIYNDSEFLKSFKFYVDGRLVGISSIYVASARSKTAGRAEAIHHLLLDEHAFYIPDAVDRVVAPAMARIPPGGTVDSFSTPNGEENEFHEWYINAKNGKSIFTPHFFPWYMHDEYVIKLGDKRINDIPETNYDEFPLDTEEETLYYVKGLTFDQIRWRRWMSMVMNSLRKRGESKTLFKQEFPEDDVSCFLATGDMYFDVNTMNRMGENCYPAPKTIDNLQIWIEPEKDGNYIVAIDPGQARISQTSLTVLQMTTDDNGNPKIRYCARDAGLYGPDITVKKAINASNYYNRCIITWEDNSHGLAITELLKDRRPIYMRKDIVSGVEMKIPGWRTSSGNKDYMLQSVERNIYDMECYDIEFVRQCRNHRLINGKLEIVGPNDVFMSCAIGIVCISPNKQKRGLVGTTGWRW